VVCKYFTGSSMSSNAGIARQLLRSSGSGTPRFISPPHTRRIRNAPSGKWNENFLRILMKCLRGSAGLIYDDAIGKIMDTQSSHDKCSAERRQLQFRN